MPTSVFHSATRQSPSNSSFQHSGNQPALLQQPLQPSESATHAAQALSHFMPSPFAPPTTNSARPQRGLPAQPHPPSLPTLEQAQYYGLTQMDHFQGYNLPRSQSAPFTPIQGPTSGHFASLHQRKQIRATQACDQCRQRKQKCDEGNPCGSCKEQNLNCQYRDTPPASRTDKNMERIIEYLEAHSAALANIEQRLGSVEQAYRSQPPLPLSERKPDLDHRTAAHKLILLWPSVKPLLQDAKVEHSESYVMEAEDRPTLRIYKRGEGFDELDGTRPGEFSSPSRSEIRGGSASPYDEVRNTSQAGTPNSQAKRAQSEGGLKPDGSLDLDEATINKLYHSYIRNMHRMHPFLDKRGLRAIIDDFIRRHSTRKTAHPRPTPDSDSESDQERPSKRRRSNRGAAVGVQGFDRDQGRRRFVERSPRNAIVWLVLALGKICLHQAPLPGPVLDNTLNANSVAAQLPTGNGILGKSPVSTPSRRSSVAEGAGRLRNLDVIPGLAYYAKAAEILADQKYENDLVHAQLFLLAGLYKGQLARVKESMGWIAMAGRAIMTLLDRHKLYREHYWAAGKDTREQYTKDQARIRTKKQSLIVLASWTCLQLESDILAELHFPSSGIQGIETMLLMPHNVPEPVEDEAYQGHQRNQQNGESDKDDPDHILMYYTAQLFLRKRLNQIHKEMYGDQCMNQAVVQVRSMLFGHEETLSRWRQGLPEGLRWEDGDHPPSDILDARLRAKYWGAAYLVNRPFLDYALHIMPYINDGRSIEEVAKDSHGNPREHAEIHLFKAIQTLSENSIWQAAKRCIDAAMQSTVAFDGVPNRLIVTNIHGTAHAQFGNMLVLAATCYNKSLHSLVPREQFHRILERTINFLRRLSPISQTCMYDCQILEKISKLLFGNVPPEYKHMFQNEFEPPSNPPSANTSFSRNP